MSMTDNMINGIGSFEDAYKQVVAQNEELRAKLVAALQAEINANDRVIALQDVLIEYMHVSTEGGHVVIDMGLWQRGMKQVIGYGELPWGGAA